MAISGLDVMVIILEGFNYFETILLVEFQGGLVSDLSMEINIFELFLSFDYFKDFFNELRS